MVVRTLHFSKIILSLLLAVFLFSQSVWAFDEIQISNISLTEKAASKFLLSGDVVNTSNEPREVILRSQISFYDRSSPERDVPVAVIHKDMTIILKPQESRRLDIPIINEGAMPKTAIRTEPSLRIRRQRVWNY